MEWIVLLVIVFLVLGVVVGKLKPQVCQPEAYPYTKNRGLFSAAERSFLGVLEQAVGEEYRVFGKVRVADIASVHAMSKRSAWLRAFNRISAKHFDFVLCAKGDLSVVAAIELDDQSHQQRKRQERDEFLVGVCQAIALPLVQIPAQRAYSVPELRDKVLTALGVHQKPLRELPARPAATAAVEAQAEPHLKASESAVAQQATTATDIPLCPKCGASMVRRQAKAGVNAGREFWGCSAFPKCRCVIPVG